MGAEPHARPASSRSPPTRRWASSKADIDEIKRFRRERAAGGDETAFRKYFRRDLHDGLVRNLRKVGLLTERIAPSLQSFGIKLRLRPGARHSGGESGLLTPRTSL